MVGSFFFSIFSSGRLIEAFVLPRIVQNIAIFSILASKSWGGGRLLQHGLLLEILRLFKFHALFFQNQVMVMLIQCSFLVSNAISMHYFSK